MPPLAVVHKRIDECKELPKSLCRGVGDVLVDHADRTPLDCRIWRSNALSSLRGERGISGIYRVSLTRSGRVEAPLVGIAIRRDPPAEHDIGLKLFSATTSGRLAIGGNLCLLALI